MDKITYVDNETVITAQNLNDIQDALDVTILNVSGNFVNSGASGSGLSGGGYATIRLCNGIAEIDYSYKVLSFGTNNTNCQYGINRDLLYNLNNSLPLITPMAGGSCIIFKADGTLYSDMNGNGATNHVRGQFWNIKRNYNASGSVGEWQETLLTEGMFVTGRCYGTY